MKKIKLTKGKFALVDDEDFDYINQWKWHYHSPGYAVRTVNSSIKGGKKNNAKFISMHREIAKAIKGEFVDHIDRNGLNNCRANLRRVTHQQNMFNRGSFQNNHLKGVYKRTNEKWEGYIKVNQKQYYVGTFPTEHLAALARDMWALEAHGEYADTNFKPIKWLGEGRGDEKS